MSEIRASESNYSGRCRNRTQHGVAIYWAFGSAATGDIQNNYIWNYQKGGIVVNGPSASSHIQENVVVGLGPVNFIAQNGIQAGYGANAINNTTGNGPTQGYQAGISDQGDYDVIQNNYICGSGYAPPGNGTAALFAIDVTRHE